MRNRANIMFTAVTYLLVIACAWTISLLVRQQLELNDAYSKTQEILNSSKEFETEAQKLNAQIINARQEQQEEQQQIYLKLAKLEKVENLNKQIEEQKKVIADPTYVSGKTNRGMARESFKMEGTGYDLSVESCGKSRNSPNYGITASGTRTTVNRTVAVDPRVIPLGSTLYIIFPAPYKNMTGYYIAEDTGSGVKGMRVDIFMGEDKPGQSIIHKKAMDFGRRNVRVYLIDKNAKAREQQKLDLLYQELSNTLDTM